ncbi:abscisic acid 8'-hydroxylase 2 [Oryza brachyantha]|uniref:abscisic acid 8'-hydroxylase 2 n=1 Tax=Oryza brachyantha TaxID=4533 RepID=UPI001AD99735|nr:abscisic acid 8'-hydroxylase 2 [Oryza brachyantha]
MAFLLFLVCLAAAACLLVPAFLLLCTRVQGSRGVEQRRLQGGKKLRLPPGSMGWPYVGETLQLYSQDPNVFFASKQKRYGEIFKTHLLGCPCVMLASPEAARFVLVSQARLFKPTYPPSKERMIGPWALFFHQGEYHLRLRRLVQGALGPDSLRALVPDVDAAVASTLAAWADAHVASTFHAMKKLSFDVGIVTIFGGRLCRRHREELRTNYSAVERGYNCFPNRFPGTLYHKAIQARKRLRAILSEIVSDRRALGGGGGDDLLGGLMRSRDDAGAAALTDDQIADNVVGVLFAAQDTTASVLTWILKYLHDSPKLLEAVKAEQMAIYVANEGGKRPLTWTQTRSMTLTHQVILESLRMASIISFTFREAVADVEYKGFLIPKGWKVMPLFRNIHHNPDYFQDPQKFDPSRFKVAPRRPSTFLPFGSGVHACPGNELAKLEMLVLVHRLATAYRWEIVGGSDEVEYSPFPVPRRGLNAKLWKQEPEEEMAMDASGGVGVVTAASA